MCAQSFRNPQVGDWVLFCAVDCEPKPHNGNNSWRAIHVVPRTIRAASRQANLAVVEAQESEELAAFLAGRGGVTVENSRIDLGPMAMNGESHVTVEMLNMGEGTVGFTGVNVGGLGKTSRKALNRVVYEGESVVRIKPGRRAAVTLKCIGGTLGRSQELVTLQFDREDVQAGVVVEFDVRHPVSDTMPTRNGYYANQSRPYNYARQFDFGQPDQILPGRRRNMGAPSYVKFRLQEYPVPRDLRAILEDNGSGDRGADAVMNVWSCLAEPLVPHNYSTKLSAILHLEELSLEESIRRYDMGQVSFDKRGLYLALEVPGLSEKRPSLVLGDSVLARRDFTFGYEGHIHEVHANVVLLQFDEKFHHTYCGEVYDVTFRFNRGPFRRLHRAAELAVRQMGPSFLFPNGVTTTISPQLNVQAEQDTRDRSPKHGGGQRRLKKLRLPPLKETAGGWMSPVLPVHLGSVAALTGFPDCGNINPKYRFDFKEEIQNLGEPYVKRDILAATGVSGKARIRWFNESLNKEQKQAVTRIMRGEARPMPYIIYGPPGKLQIPNLSVNCKGFLLNSTYIGTGKTVTVVECILQLFVNLPNSRLLVCTPSNSSADLIAERLAANASRCRQLRQQLARLNAFTRKEDSIPESVKPFSFQSGATGDESSDMDVLRNVALRRIVVATCATAGTLHRLVTDVSKGACGFTHCLIDEAGHLGEAETLLPIILLGTLSREKAQQVVLAGDPMQLGPVAQSLIAKNCGAEESMLERLSRRQPYLRDAEAFADHGGYDPLLVTKLVRNYRSHRSIIKVRILLH